MRSQKNTVIYMPLPDDASDPWSVVAAALRAAGIRDIRPAPMPAQTYTPRHARSILVSSVEV